MSIKIWNPFQELARLENDINKAFEGSTSGFFSPLTDVKETNDDIIIHMNVPGMRPEDIKIEATGDYIEIKAEKSITDDKSEKKNKWTARHIERRSEKYYRKMHFNVPVDPQNAKLTLTDGVLNIILPKSPEAKKVQLKLT
jgi:HSP20 family protein